jgi:hypothetical protein
LGKIQGIAAGRRSGDQAALELADGVSSRKFAGQVGAARMKGGLLSFCRSLQNAARYTALSSNRFSGFFND